MVRTSTMVFLPIVLHPQLKVSVDAFVTGDSSSWLYFSKSRSNGYRGSSSIKYPISYDLPIIGYGFRVIG